MEARKPGDLITPEEILEHSRDNNFVLTAVGMSGAGKTHFDNLIKAEHPNWWDTFSVDGNIQQNPTVKFQTDQLLTQALLDLPLSSEIKSEWIALICNRQSIPQDQIKILADSVEKYSSIPKAMRPIFLEGVRNIQDPENLSFLTLWNNFNGTKYDELEDLYTHEGLTPKGKHRYLSTTGSVINLQSATRNRIKSLSTVVHFDLDTEKYVEECIDQMDGKPISLDEKHYMKWAESQKGSNRNEVADWIRKNGSGGTPHADYLPEFIKWRRAKYKELAHINLKRSEMEGISSHELLEMTVDTLFEAHLGKLKKQKKATKARVDELKGMKEEILPSLSQTPLKDYGKGNYETLFPIPSSEAA